MTRDIVLTLKNKRLTAFSVFIPMLLSDSKNPAAEAAKEMKKAGIASFWDGDSSLGKAYAQTVDLPAGHKIAWDIYFVYGPDAVWDKTPPKPAYWMHQLGSDERFLNSDKLRIAVKKELQALR